MATVTRDTSTPLAIDLKRRPGGLRILVTGRIGSGKSALINCMVGSDVAEEGDSPNGTTMSVMKYKTQHQGLLVTIYDSPGLHDRMHWKRYLVALRKVCPAANLNLYCVKINDKINPARDIELLSKVYGSEKFWQDTIIVLTFANEGTAGDWTERSSMLHDKLISTGINKRIADNVKVVLVGSCKESHLEVINSDDWLSELMECLLGVALDRFRKELSVCNRLDIMFSARKLVPVVIIRHRVAELVG